MSETLHKFEALKLLDEAGWQSQAPVQVVAEHRRCDDMQVGSQSDTDDTNAINKS